MFYKLSNTAPRKLIEKELRATFEYPNLYKPMPVINGLEESNLPIVTMDDSTKIKIGIWGLMPQNLEDNWQVYQNLTNTLNINTEQLDLKNPLYSNALDSRRCIIITTGFFTSAMHDGKMFPYHVYRKNYKPFAIAGVYNQLEDGFITCSILLNDVNESMENVPNMLAYKPMVLNKDDQDIWLDKSNDFDSLKDSISTRNCIEFFSQPVPKEFYDNDIIYTGIIDSNTFDKLLQSS